MRRKDGTTVRERMLELLEDGKPHTRADLHKCCYDELTDLRTIQVHLSMLRKDLAEEGRGRTVICVLHDRTICYQLVKLVKPTTKPEPPRL